MTVTTKMNYICRGLGTFCYNVSCKFNINRKTNKPKYRKAVFLLFLASLCRWTCNIIYLYVYNTSMLWVQTKNIQQQKESKMRIILLSAFDEFVYSIYFSEFFIVPQKVSNIECEKLINKYWIYSCDQFQIARCFSIILELNNMVSLRYCQYRSIKYIYTL